MVIVPIVAKEFANHLTGQSGRTDLFVCIFLFVCVFCGQFKLSFIQWN